MAIGHLEILWAGAYESGEPELGDAEDVEALAGWDGDPGVLAAALLDAGGSSGAGFLEKNSRGLLEIHDFWDHAPRYVRDRYQREIKRQEEGKTLSDKRREAALARWGKDTEKGASDLQPSAHGKQVHANKIHLHANGINRDANCSTPAPAPALALEEENTPSGCVATARNPSQSGGPANEFHEDADAPPTNPGNLPPNPPACAHCGNHSPSADSRESPRPCDCRTLFDPHTPADRPRRKRRRAPPDTVELPPLPLDLAAFPGMPEAWEERMAVVAEKGRRDVKFRFTPSQVEAQFKRLRAVAEVHGTAGPAAAVECVKDAAAGGWQGVVFPQDLDPTGRRARGNGSRNGHGRQPPPRGQRPRGADGLPFGASHDLMAQIKALQDSFDEGDRADAELYRQSHA